MGQPSSQASNAIIYLTYGAFLYVSIPTFSQHPGASILKAPTAAGVRACTLLGIGGVSPSRNSWLQIAHRRVRLGRSRRSFKRLAQAGSLALISETFHIRRETWTDDYVAIPLALNFIASGECDRGACVFAA